MNTDMCLEVLQVFNYIPKTFRFDLSFHSIQNDNKRVLGL